MKSFIKDYEFGKKCESEILNILNRNFPEENIRHLTSRYSVWDFQGKNYVYELKSRNCKYNDFKTTLLPKNKLCRSDIILLFNFTDGLYYIDYYNNKDLFNEFEVKPFKRTDRIDRKERVIDYIYIPIEHLKKIE